MLSDGKCDHGAVGGGDFIEAYLPERRQGRIAKLRFLLAAMLGLLVAALLIRVPEARLAFRESPLIIDLRRGRTCGKHGDGSHYCSCTPQVGSPQHSCRPSGLTDPVTYSFDAEHFSVCSTYAQASYPWERIGARPIGSPSPTRAAQVRTVTSQPNKSRLCFLLSRA